MMANASAFLRDEVERQRDKGESFEKKRPLVGVDSLKVGVDPLQWRRKDEVRALVCYPWGGRQVKEFVSSSMFADVVKGYFVLIGGCLLPSRAAWMELQCSLLPSCKWHLPAYKPAGAKVGKNSPSCFCAQAYAWPAITALRSVVMVGSRGQGKTVLLGFLTMKYHYFSSS